MQFCPPSPPIPYTSPRAVPASNTLSTLPNPQVYDQGNLNADGFGLGWYANDEVDDVTPCVFSDVGPAWHNKNLHNIAKKITSPVIFAHVRAAGPGMSLCTCSCHPFSCGRYLFMHNGQVAGFKQIRRGLMNRLSDVAFNFAVANSASDSALAFAIFIDALPVDPLEEAPSSVIRDTLVRTIEVNAHPGCYAPGSQRMIPSATYQTRLSARAWTTTGCSARL